MEILSTTVSIHMAISSQRTIEMEILSYRVHTYGDIFIFFCIEYHSTVPMFETSCWLMCGVAGGDVAFWYTVLHRKFNSFYLAREFSKWQFSKWQFSKWYIPMENLGMCSDRQRKIFFASIRHRVDNKKAKRKINRQLPCWTGNQMHFFSFIRTHFMRTTTLKMTQNLRTS